MRRWLPFPSLSLSLLAMWLLLNQALTPGHALLGSAFGFGGGLVLAALQAPGRRVRRGAVIVELCGLVFVDVVRSNVAVAHLVLHRGTRKGVAGFVRMPIALRDPGALAALACIITVTPGTSWARLDRRQNVLVIHVLDLIDEEQWVHKFKDRYERRLLEVFE